MINPYDTYGVQLGERRLLHGDPDQPYRVVGFHLEGADASNVWVDVVKHNDVKTTWLAVHAKEDPIEAPKPERKTFTVTTEHRLAKRGETYVCPTDITIAVAPFDFNSVPTYVVVEVVPS